MGFWIFEISAKKGWLLNFEWEKTNSPLLGPPLEKCPSGTPWKKSFRRPCLWRDTVRMPSNCNLFFLF